jgi:hypothetical protein
VIDRVEKRTRSTGPGVTVTQLADYGFQLQTDKIARQMVEIREGLLELTKRWPDLNVSHDRSDILDILTVLPHRLSGLRAHVDIANREVALAKMVRQAENGMGRDGHRSSPVNGFMRTFQDARVSGQRGIRAVGMLPATVYRAGGATGFNPNYRLKLTLVMKRKRPKLVVLDPEDFSEIALEKSAQRRQDQLDIAAGADTGADRKG